MRKTRVNEILWRKGLSTSQLARRVALQGRPCSKAQVSQVATGARRTPWLQTAIARELGVSGPRLFGDWWHRSRRNAASEKGRACAGATRRGQ